MFGARFFGPRYYGQRYWGKVGASVAFLPNNPIRFVGPARKQGFSSSRGARFVARLKP